MLDAYMLDSMCGGCTDNGEGCERCLKGRKKHHEMYSSKEHSKGKEDEEE